VATVAARAARGLPGLEKHVKRLGAVDEMREVPIRKNDWKLPHIHCAGLVVAPVGDHPAHHAKRTQIEVRLQDMVESWLVGQMHRLLQLVERVALDAVSPAADEDLLATSDFDHGLARNLHFVPKVPSGDFLDEAMKVRAIAESQDYLVGQFLLPLVEGKEVELLPEARPGKNFRPVDAHCGRAGLAAEICLAVILNQELLDSVHGTLPPFFWIFDPYVVVENSWELFPREGPTNWSVRASHAEAIYPRLFCSKHEDESGIPNFTPIPIKARRLARIKSKILI